MRKLVLATVTLAAVGFTGTLSTAQAENYWGPLKNGNMCWKRQLGNSLGYWEDCTPPKAAHASAVRRTGKKTSR
jgi:hypothetical protein